jgi:hypothetical protein
VKKKAKKVNSPTLKTSGSQKQALDDQLMLEAVRALRMWQQSQSLESNRTGALDIANLAIELARLRGQTEPGQFLDEAARLLTEACFAMSREMSRPEREAKERSEQIIQLLKEGFTAQMVPFSKLCRPATHEENLGASALSAVEVFEFESKSGIERFEWRVYRDVRDFKELLEKHAKRICDAKQLCNQVGAELARLKKVLETRKEEAETSSQPSSADATTTLPTWGQVATALIENRYWFPEDWRKKFLAVESTEAGVMVAKEYVKAAIPAIQEKLLHEAKADNLDTCTLFSIHQTRFGTYKTRGPKR